LNKAESFLKISAIQETSGGEANIASPLTLRPNTVELFSTALLASTHPPGSVVSQEEPLFTLCGSSSGDPAQVQPHEDGLDDQREDARGIKPSLIQPRQT
jgi:hypothetical protein